MTRKFKALGAAFVAVLAMSAVAATAAQAEIQVQAAQYPATIEATGEKIGEYFETEAGKVECQVSHFHGSLAGPSKELTVTPSYTNCTAFGFVEATVNTEGCHYTFIGTEHHAATGKFTAHVTLTCEAGKSIKITASTCKVEVKGHQSLTTVDITNMVQAGADDITVTPTVENIAYTVTQDGFLCPFNGTGNKAGGKYGTAAPITTIATNTIGQQIDLKVATANT